MKLRALLMCVVLSLSGLAFGQTPVKVKAGMVAAIDQIGLPIALERGFFEKVGARRSLSCGPIRPAWMR